MPTIQQVKPANWISVQLNLRNGHVFQTFVKMQGRLSLTAPFVSKFEPPLEKGVLNPLHALLHGAPQPNNEVSSYAQPILRLILLGENINSIFRESTHKQRVTTPPWVSQRKNVIPTH